ncbi:hypothetical protein RhiirC2_795200 [Rhizophagus irregularis]|uniref:Uncharacterized protein n=1 Tax=Rhizophagus irregularis TaxID=588596 RepID=A0A2N1MC16_9GLOM|nr:hypothetical protein RhiirC2_795200 [Rhizophagus irregularis]
MYHILLKNIITKEALWRYENFIRHIPSTLQRSGTKNSKMSGWETERSENEHRWSDDHSNHYMGCSYPLLYDQYWQTSKIFDFSRSADKMAVSTFRPVVGVDNDFRAFTQECRDNQGSRSQGPTPAGDNSCGVEIKTSEDHKNTDLEIHHLFPRDANGTLEEKQETWPFGSYAETNPLFHLASWGRELPIRTRAIETDTKETMQPCANCHLIMKHNTPEMWCCYLKVPGGVIYIWSRIDDYMILGGNNMEEALTNYLFHRENLRYVDEYTLELVPLDVYDEEDEKWAKSPEAYVDIDVTKVSLNHESKMGGKKKQQKKKKKNKNKKNKNKH